MCTSYLHFICGESRIRDLDTEIIIYKMYFTEKKSKNIVNQTRAKGTLELCTAVCAHRQRSTPFISAR